MRRVSNGRTVSTKLFGGPWDGEKIPLRGDTMVFRVGEFKGRYLFTGRWVNVL